MEYTRSMQIIIAFLLILVVLKNSIKKQIKIIIYHI